MPKFIPASIEVSPKQACQSEVLIGLFPENTSVYITDIGQHSDQTWVTATQRLRTLGYHPVPHIAARRIPSLEALEQRIRLLSQQAGITDMLIIGGGLPKPAGVFDSSLAILNTGIFERYGILHIGIAGHPEGTPDFSEEVAMETLHEKQAFADRTGLNLRIVTQFGFDACAFTNWARDVKAAGINLPIHLGVAGPTKLTTLINFASMCGIGNSLHFLKQRGGTLNTLIQGFNPDDIVQPIEDYWARTGSESPITHIHVFPFGGVKKSAEWLKARGSWPAPIPHPTFTESPSYRKIS